MELTFRPATSKDFDEFYAACFPLHLNNGPLCATIKYEWNWFLEGYSPLSIVLEDQDRPEGKKIIGCAQAVFVSQEFAHAVHAGLPPWLNAYISTTQTSEHPFILDYQGVRFANSTSGLTLLITRWTVADEDYNASERLRLTNGLMQAFAVFASGYNIKEVFVEATGETTKEEALRSGLTILNDYAEHFGGTPPLPEERPCLFHITREMAWERPGSLATWILGYTPPIYKFDFNERHQAVIRWALAGADVFESAQKLHLAVNTLHKEWREIYALVEEKVPDFFQAEKRLPKPKRKAQKKTPENSKSPIRGDGKRPILLKYMHTHPEELCPFDSSASVN